MKKIFMIVALLSVLQLWGQDNAKPTHWGAGGQMPEARPARDDAHRRALRKYDANKDGKLDPAEREAMLRDRKSAASR